MNCQVFAPTQFSFFLKLPEHIQVKIMACSSVKNMLNLAETCTHMHHLLLATPRLMKRLKLVVKFTRSNNDVVDKLSTILSNASIGRKYFKVKLLYANEGLQSYVKPLMLKILNIVGRSVDELDIHSGRLSIQDMVTLLECFNNLEKLSLINLQEGALSETNEVDLQKKLPRLQKLQLQDTMSSFLGLFEKFTTLHHFKFHRHTKGPEVFSYGIVKFEDFLLQQRHLKSLEIGRMHKNCLFYGDRVQEIKFQLESLTANRFFVQKNNAEKFFRMQRGLKSIKLHDFFDSRIFPVRIDYSIVLKIIFSLPALESIGIFNNSINLEDFEMLSDVQNASVRNLEYDMWNATALEKFINIFPNLKSISFRCFTVKLRDIAHEKLAIMNISGGNSLEEFSYQPISVCKQNNFECTLKSFIIRHKTIKHLALGSLAWLEEDFGLTLNFWIEILYHLTDLCEIVIYNPRQIRELVMMLSRNKNAFKSVNLYTTAAGKEATQGLERHWLKVYAVDAVRMTQAVEYFIV